MAKAFSDIAARLGNMKAADMQEAVNRGEVRWRPDMMMGDTKILPPTGSGYAPAQMMEWAKKVYKAPKDMYFGKTEVPQEQLAEALRAQTAPAPAPVQQYEDAGQ